MSTLLRVPPGWAEGVRGRGAPAWARPERVSSSVVRVSSGMETFEVERLCWNLDEEERERVGGVVGSREEGMVDVEVEAGAGAGASAVAGAANGSEAVLEPDRASYCWSRKGAEGRMKQVR